ncbi:hypothetical protein [Streptomyces sp. NPDC007063]|uniref:hypothetical protein n=1 Tax=Streptomyces sp. NPDC007063 TaxID=3364772 RepID=UPI0036CFD9C6
MRHWAAVEGDLSAVHHLTAGQLAALSLRRFLVLLGSLPPESRFARAWRSTPRHVVDPNEIAQLTA